VQTSHRTPRGLAIALLGIAGFLATVLVAAPPAQATSSIICKGFTACEAAGYSSFGYGPTNYQKMWWRMYSGHNCTNYMAYRMIQSGMPTQRPWSSTGDARNWGVVFSSKTNQTPLIGSVAWWSSNHVAYVQKVIDANTIIISEDHYGGDFDWRQIVRSGGGWPTGFIHLEDETVTPTAPPSVTGTPQVDQLLVAKPGKWNRTGTKYAYQWLAAGKAILGATTARYTPGPDEVGDTFSVKVTASKPGYKTGSSVTPVTLATVPGVMAVTGVPTISGVAKVGGLLTASLPTWAPTADMTQYAWFADGQSIPGSSGLSLTLNPDQLGKVITFVATGVRNGYTDAAAAAVPTAAVLPEKLVVSTEPVLDGDPYLGLPISVTPGVVTPAAKTRYRWFSNGVAIGGATSPTYTPTTSDVGTRLTVTVSYTRPGYTTIVRNLKPHYEVRSFARIYVSSRSHKSLSIKMVTGPTGKTQTLTLKNGTVTFTAAWLYSGSRTLRIDYLGSYRVVARTRSQTVVIK
jgi:surface antigen